MHRNIHFKKLIQLMMTFVIGLAVIFVISADRLYFPAVYVLIWLALSIWTIRLAVKRSSFLAYPLIMGMFFIVGFPLKIMYLATVPENENFLPRRSGMYFENASFTVDLRIAVTAALFILGTGLGAVLARNWARKKNSLNSLSCPTTSRRPLMEDRVKFLVLGWFLASMLLAGFMYHYDIGKTGISAKINTFRLAGLCVYLRSVSFPILWLYLWSTLPRLQKSSRRICLILAICSGIEIISLSFLQMSRKVGVELALLAIMLFIKMWDELSRTFRRFVMIAAPIVITLLIFVIIPATTHIRQIDQSRRLGVKELTSRALNYSRTDSSSSLRFIFDRVLGVEDLMAVCAYEDRSFNRLYRAVFKGQAGVVLYHNIFNLSQFMGYRGSSGRTLIGKGVCPAAMLALSGSASFVFLISLIVSFFVCLVEINYDRIGLPAFAVIFAIIARPFLAGYMKVVYYPLAAFIVTQWVFRKWLIPWLEGGKNKVYRQKNNLNLKQNQNLKASTFFRT